MTIKRASHRVDGKLVEGFEIGCCACPQTSFLVSVKHLPPEVITKKFQDRKWDTDKKGADLCPNCVEKRHQRLPRRRRGEERITPILEHLPLNASMVAKVVSEAGIPGVMVTEVEGKCPKFKINLPNLNEVSLPRLRVAEGRLIEVFDADFESNYLKPELSHTNGGNTVSVSVAFNWIIGLKPRFHEPVSEAAE